MEHAISHTKEVGRGEDIIREGDRPKESTLVLEGFAARYKMLNTGQRQITSLHLVGDFVDLHSFFLKRMDHGVVALTPCKLAFVPHEAIYRITEDNPHLSRLLSLSIAVDGAVHRQWLAMRGRGLAYVRLAHLFCELFVRLNGVEQTKGNSFRLSLTQSELGDVLGISTVHVNRTLQELRRDGLLTWEGKVLEIKDWDRLQEIAEFEPTYLNLITEPR